VCEDATIDDEYHRCCNVLSSDHYFDSFKLVRNKLHCQSYTHVVQCTFPYINRGRMTSYFIFFLSELRRDTISAVANLSSYCLSLFLSFFLSFFLSSFPLSLSNSSFSFFYLLSLLLTLLGFEYPSPWVRSHHFRS
jgi:hypothetical protein